MWWGKGGDDKCVQREESKGLMQWKGVVRGNGADSVLPIDIETPCLPIL